MEPFADALTLEDIPENSIYRRIAEEIGVEGLIKLAELVGGTTFYIPKPETLIRPVRDEMIKREYNGYNAAVLARKYNVTDRWVRTICGDGRDENQTSLFHP